MRRASENTPQNMSRNVSRTNTTETPKQRFIRPPRSLVDVNTKGAAISSAIMLETCCVYLLSNEMYMVGYRKNDLDDCTDIDGLLAKVEPLTLESIVQPPRVIQSFIRDVCTCPRLAQHDICFALTNEYSVLFCARGATLAEFHFSEVLESFFPEEMVEEFNKRDQSQAFGTAGVGQASSPVVMHICESVEILVVAVQGYVLVLTLDLEFILQNIHYFNVDEGTATAFGMSGQWDEEEMRAVWEQNPEATVFDLACSKCIKGATLLDSADWMLFSPDPQLLSRLPALQSATGNSYSKWVNHTERCAVWCADTEEGLACSLVCSGHGSWIEFLPLVRGDRGSKWERKRNNETGFNPADSRASVSMYYTKPSTNDHESWVTAVSTGDNMSLGCTGDSTGCLVMWQSVSDEELQRVRRERKEKKRLHDLAEEKARRERGEDVQEREEQEDRLDTANEGTAEYSAKDYNESMGEAGGVEGESKEEQQDDAVREASHISLAEQSLLEGGFKKLFKIHFSPTSPISCISKAPQSSNDSFWVGDHSGAVTCVTVQLKTFNYQRITKVHVLSPGSAPSAISWLPSLNPENDVDGRLRFLCQSAGIVIEAQIQNTACLFNASAGPSFAPNHRSIIETCAVFLELELLITAGTSHTINIWNLITCELEATITSPDLYCTCIAVFDNGYVQGGVARILTGHSSGNIHDYVLYVDKVVTTNGSIGASEQSSQAGAGSVHSGVHAGASRKVSVTSVDILDALQDGAKEGDEDDKWGSLEPSTAETPVGHLAGSLVRSMSNKSGSSKKLPEGHHMATQYVAKYEKTYKYCPMPVTSILYSSLGLYFSFCYAFQNITIHDWEREAIFLQLELDQLLTSVSVLTSYEMEDIHQDSFILALHGKQGIKFLDALGRQFIDQLTLDTQGKPIQSCTLWSNAGQEIPELRQVGGLFVEHGMHAYTVNDDKNLNPVYENTTLRYEAGDTDSLDSVVLGTTGVHEMRAPWAALWGLRKAVMLRIQGTQVFKTREYAIANDKSRFVYVLSLKITPQIRANRLVVVLSDGTCGVLHLI